MLDSVFVAIASQIVIYFVVSAGSESWSILVSLILNLVYWVAPTYMTGATLGKTLLGLQVVTKNSSADLGFLQILLRETVGRFLAMLPLFLGYIWFFFSEDRRGWHDYIGGTRVIETHNQ